MPEIALEEATKVGKPEEDMSLTSCSFGLNNQLVDKGLIRVVACQRDRRAEALEERLVLNCVIRVAKGVQRRAKIAEDGRFPYVHNECAYPI